MQRKYWKRIKIKDKDFTKPLANSIDIPSMMPLKTFDEKKTRVGNVFTWSKQKKKDVETSLTEKLKFFI